MNEQVDGQAKKSKRIRRMIWKNLSMVKNPANRTHWYTTKEEKEMRVNAESLEKEGCEPELVEAAKQMDGIYDELPDECRKAMDKLMAGMVGMARAHKEERAAKEEKAADEQKKIEQQKQAEADKAKADAEAAKEQAAKQEKAINEEVEKRVAARMDEMVAAVGEELGTLVEEAVKKRAG